MNVSMRSYFTRCCLVLLLCGHTKFAAAQDGRQFYDSVSNRVNVPSDNPMASATDSLVEKIARPYIQQKHTVGLSIAVIQNDVVHRYNYGEVRRGSGQLPDPATTLFEIGSVTKTFTALLLAREVIAGRMRLKDPVSRYLPDSIPDLSYQGKAITLQQLSNHTSGFPRLPANIFGSITDRADPYLNYDENLLYSFLMTYRLTSEPGTNFLYSNYGAGLLGSLLARKTQRTFESLILEEICRPLKMNDTKITLSKKDSARFAQGYDEKGAPTAPWNFTALQGTGSIRSTLNDMITYILAQSGKRPAPPALQKAMRLTQQKTFQNKDNAIGLGWLIEQKGDHIYRHHAGGTGGFRSFVGFEENGRFGVVILSNTSEDVAPLGVSFFTQQKF